MQLDGHPRWMGILESDPRLFTLVLVPSARIWSSYVCAHDSNSLSPHLGNVECRGAARNGADIVLFRDVVEDDVACGAGVASAFHRC